MQICPLSSRAMFRCAAVLMSVLWVSEPSSVRSAEIGAEPGTGLDDVGAKMEAFVKASAAFTGDTRVTERDIKAILKLESTMAELNTKAEAWGEAAFESGKFDYDALVKDVGYGAWAKANRVAPKEFLQKLIRLQLFVARDEAVQGADEARKQLTEKLKELESMRSQLGEENHKQMRAMLEASSSAILATQKAFAQLPTPTNAEKKLLQKYETQIRKALQLDDEVMGE